MHQVRRELDVLFQCRTRIEPVIVRQRTLPRRRELVRAPTRRAVRGEERLVRVPLWTRPPAIVPVATLVPISIPIRIPGDPTEKDRRIPIRLPRGLSRMIRIPDLSASMPPEEKEDE